MALQEYIGQIEITDSCKDLSVNNGTAYAVALTTGTYYAQGYSGESAAQLIEHLQAQIRAANAAFAASGANECTVSRSSSTGLITIAFAAGGGNVSVTWTDTALGTLLGYTGNLSGGYSYAATYTPKGVWRPTRALVDLPGDESLWWGERSTSLVTVTPSGTTYGMEGTLLYDGEYRYESLTKAEVDYSSSVTWQTFWSFWENVVHQVLTIRVLPDRTSYTSTTYREAIMLPAGAETGSGPVRIGHIRDYSGRTVSDYNGLWDVAFMLAKRVSA